MNQMDITTKANKLLLSGEFNKMTLADELGISRPTLDNRLENNTWKKLEAKWITKLSKDYAIN